MTPAGRPAESRNKAKGEENIIDKYMSDSEEVWKRGIEKIIVEIEEM